MKRKTDNLFGDLPCCAKDFIELVIKKMRYRKKVRADVMSELAAHFEDELRDCKSDEEKQQRAEQLIEEFGDVKLLGVLLRRAKKRCRPLWRTIVAKTFQTIGIMLLCFIVYTIWFFSGKPTISVDYLAIWNQMNRPQLADEDNAWPNYEKAVELFVTPDKKLEDIMAFKNLRSSYVRFDELDLEDQKKIRTWVLGNDAAWRQYTQASNKSYCYRKVRYNENDEEKWMLNILLPELGTLRNLARLGIWKSRIEIDNGQTDIAIDECLAVIRTGRFWQGSQATIVEQLVGMAISNLGYGEILNILSSCDVDSKQMQHIQQQLLDIYRDGFPAMDFEGEKIMFMDIVQHIFTDGGLGGGHLIPERMSLIYEIIPNIGNGVFGDYDNRGDTAITLLFTAPAMYHARRNKTVAKADEIYNQMGRFAKMTPYQCRINDVNGKKLVESVLTYKYLLVRMFIPAFDRVSELTYRTKILHEAAITILALQRCKLEQGKYPEDLAELQKSGCIKNIPIDPWSDKPLIYKKTKDDFTLYSVGFNFIDDGGVPGTNNKGKPRYMWANDGDTIFWPVEK